MIRVEKTNDREVTETKVLFDDQGAEEVVHTREFGDVQILRDYEEAQKQLTFWQGIDGKNYVAKQIAEAQKKVDETEARYNAMDLSPEEWEAVKLTINEK